MLSRTIVVAMSFLLTATASGLHAETPVYGVLASSPDTPYWRAMELGLRDGASEEMVDYYAQSVDLSVGTAETNSALEICRSMLDRKPNILLVALPDVATLPACFEKAQRLNIPVIIIGSSSAEQDDNYISSTVMTDHNETAAITAGYLSSALGNNTEGAVVIPVTGSNTLAVEILKEKLKENAPSLTVIAVTPQELVNVAPDIRAIISTDNASILNAVNDQLPEADNTLILSVDGQADNTALLETGLIDASITPLPYLLGKTAIQQASKEIARPINANNSNDAVFIKPVLLTQQMLKDGSDPVLEYIK